MTSRTTLLSTLLPLLVHSSALAVGVPDFTFEVQPLLSDTCLRCHGPDSAGRKADLRLDQPKGLFGPVKDKPGLKVVTPGDRAKSELWLRVTTRDPDDLMPPPESHQVLTPAQIDLLGRWIDSGAEWKPHWAFVAPPAVVPVPEGGPWARNEIDRFVLERLRREGLEPSPEAPREVWLRRASFGLTGLPPSEAELAAFQADTSADAYEKAADRLLASVGHAEHMAVKWLDLARYGDSFGYQSDVPNRMWPWRDWVIDAYRRNLPFDQFLTWQLAGDLLPAPTPEQILATGFNRNHRMTNEGGSIDAEFQTEYVVDRVSTFGTAFLGLTLECSRCHDHKYDPVSQKEFYQLFAFFNRIDESGLYAHFTQAVPSPSLPLYKDGQAERHQALLADVRKAEEALDARRKEALSAYRTQPQNETLSPALPIPVAHFPFDTENGAKVGDNRVDAAKTAALHDGPQPVVGRVGGAVHFNGDNGVSIKGVGEYGRSRPFSFSLWLRAGETNLARQVVLHRSRAYSDSGSRGYELVLEHGRPTWSLIHFWPGEAIRIASTQPLPAGEWQHLTVTYDGSSRAAGLGLFVNGQRVATETVRDHLTLDIRHRGEWGDSDVNGVHLTLANRFRDSGFKSGEIDDLRVFDRALTPHEVQSVARDAGVDPARLPAPAEAERALAWWEQQTAMAEAREAARVARKAEDDFITGIPRVMVMRDEAKPRPTHFLNRGAYDQPGERVEVGVPSALLPFPADAPQNRLGLARWLTHPEHPLTARVAVNRLWAMVFGEGLVATAEDFGSQGRMPTHPQLLDWLARAYQKQGWDSRALLKSMVLSATFRQSSGASAALLARDPGNHLFARGPRYRLAAEGIRDAVLAASSLLVAKVGGESVKPYQPAGLWEESGTGKSYTQAKGEGLYRRSLYTFWRRTMPPPSMTTFDAPSREFCLARREVTITPMQALVLLNDPQFLEASRVLAVELMGAGLPEEEQIRRAFVRLLSRAPTPGELAFLTRLRADQRALFTTAPDGAKAYVAVGDSPAGRDLPPAEVAAAAVTVNAILNLDEFVVLR